MESRRGRGMPMRGGRGGRAPMKSKPREKALLRTNVVKLEQTTSARRLQKDLKDLEDQTVPLVGISARPLSSCMFTWHGNLRGPEGTLFEGGVFHFEIVFPQNYPCAPPTLKLFTTIPHPNVFGDSICLDILDVHQKQIYQGWTSAYTVETILIQLQSFLFEEFPSHQLKENKVKIKEALKLANSYKCSHPECNHQGPIKPYPPFNIKEKDINAFYNIKSYDEIKQEELVCFHTKAKLKETTLGIGISMSRLPRTGEIRTINPTLDLLSLKAFIKHKVRFSLSNEKFTHWLPLYFGEKDIIETTRKIYDADEQKSTKKTIQINQKERCIHLLIKSLKYISSGSTRKPFKTSMILEVLPKIVLTHIAEITQEMRHVSSLAIKRLVNFIRLFSLLLELYPEVELQINQKIESFIQNKDKRVKDYTPSLGDLLAMITVSSKYKIQDLLEHYLEEQLDRQVFWILKEIPELDHEDPKYKDKDLILEDARSEACFKTGLSGFHITLFFYYFNKMVMEKNYGGNEEENAPKSLTKMCQFLDSNYGTLDSRVEDEFQKKCFEIQRVKSFNEYYPLLGVSMPDKNALRERLKVAIENSRKKGYHAACYINEIPKIQTQGKDYILRDPNPFTFQDKESKEFLKAEDSKWMQACLQRFAWIASLHRNTSAGQELKPYQYAVLSDENALENRNCQQIKEEDDVLSKQLRIRNNSEFINKISDQTIIEDYNPQTFSWRDLFMKLCFEEMLFYFPQHQSFELFYQFIQDVGPFIHCLRLSILDKSKFKSNHYWLMTLLGRMPSIKILKIHKDSITGFGVDGYKFLLKGFQYFEKSQGSLTKLRLSNILGYASTDYLNSCLKCIPELRVLQVTNNVISFKDAQSIGKVLSDFKFIQEVDLTNAGLDFNTSKEIADGLMRAKQLQIFKASRNPSLGKGADAFLYNLAFSPKISFIDLSQNQMQSAETAEALYKLVKISGSLESLILKNTMINGHLQETFFKALGENKTIQYLNLDATSASSQGFLQLLGKACAMNKRKNGSLIYLSIERTINSYSNLNAFIESFKVSDHSHELWYGEAKVAKDMQKDQLVNKFEFGLKYLNFAYSQINNNNFKLRDYIKRVKPLWPAMFDMLRSKGLETLNFSGCSLQKNDMELLATCLYNEIDKNIFGYEECNLKVLNLRKNPILKEGVKILATALEGNKSIEYLDLSLCRLGVSGTVAIANALKKNDTLKTLNLYRNKVDVDGARALRELLEVNTSIEFLDLGYNRLREKGVAAITDGICKNPDSKIKHLGVRFNFITDDGFNYFFENCIIQKKSKIDHIYAIQNYLTEFYTLELNKRLEEAGIKIYMDQLDKVQYLNQDRIDRSVWISPITANQLLQPEKIWKFFQVDFESGLISSVRVKKGQKIPGKPKENMYAVIEYAHVNSVPRSLRIASKKKSVLEGNRFRIYKSGTRTMVFIRPQRKR